MGEAFRRGSSGRRRAGISQDSIGGWQRRKNNRGVREAHRRGGERKGGR